jgi:hypothetical protein
MCYFLPGPAFQDCCGVSPGLFWRLSLRYGATCARHARMFSADLEGHALSWPHQPHFPSTAGQAISGTPCARFSRASGGPRSVVAAPTAFAQHCWASQQWHPLCALFQSIWRATLRRGPAPIAYGRDRSASLHLFAALGRFAIGVHRFQDSRIASFVVRPALRRKQPATSSPTVRITLTGRRCTLPRPDTPADARSS